MRKVLFKKWIKPVFENSKLVNGTRCFESEFISEGIFHQWAAAYEESGAGFGNYTVALIENPDGTISEVKPENVKFLNQ
jgi:hypothetical protein